MYLNTQGIIFRRTKYSESSLILDVYTLEKGRKSFIISGIRGKKSKTHAGLLQVMGIVEITAYDRDKETLERIKEIKADHLFQKIPFDPLRSCMGIFLMEVCSKSVKETESNARLFHFLRNTLIRLDTVEKAKLKNFHIHFLLGLSKFLGIAIQDNFDDKHQNLSLAEGSFVQNAEEGQYVLDSDTSLFIHQLINKENEDIPKRYRNYILNKLIEYYRYHLDDFTKIKSLEVLRTIFS